MGKYSEAEKAYGSAVDEALDDAFLKSRSLEGLGLSLEAQKRYKEAEERFQEMATLADGAFKPLAGYHVARMYIAQGDKERAAGKLNEVITLLQQAGSDENRARNRYVMFEATARLRELGHSPRRAKRAGAGASRKTVKGQSKTGEKNPESGGDKRAVSTPTGSEVE